MHYVSDGVANAPLPLASYATSYKVSIHSQVRNESQKKKKKKNTRSFAMVMGRPAKRSYIKLYCA